VLFKKLQCYVTPWRLKWYSRAILFSFGISVLIAVFACQGASTLTGRLGGDYPAFYGAGRIIASGDWQDLYSASRQIEAQKTLFPNEDLHLLPFSYPPFVALAYYPFSLFNYRISYLIHTIFMIGALILTIQLIRPFNTLIDRYPLCALALTLSFYPLYRAILGGQNIATLLLLIIGSWRLVLARREWLAGLVLGLLLFKPQFAIPLIGLYVLSGRWRVGLGSVCTAAVLYAISSWVSGPLWVVSWTKFTWWFSQTDAAVNRANSISWLGFFEAIGGTNSQVALILGWIMILLTAIGLLLLWTIPGRREDITAQLAITMPALALMPPHVMYYDLSLILFSFAVMTSTNFEKYLPIFGLVWLLSFSQVISNIIGFSPLFILLVYTGIMAFISSIWLDRSPQAINY
jgi:alpha-1,2-mannosyltransferase